MVLKAILAEYEAFEAGVAEELRRQRKRANISLKDMSKQIGLHPNSIAKCERHEYGIGLNILYGYAKVLGRSVVTFFNQLESNDQPDNPVADLGEDEMIRYSQILQSIFMAFSEQGIKLSGGCSLDATKLAARAIIEHRQSS